MLIIGANPPKSCYACSWYNKVECPVNDGRYYYRAQRHPSCPLIELPPHGRLIDVDEPMTKISTMMQEPDYQHEGENWMVGLIMARDAIDEAPTVIEAEGETDGR